MTNQIIQTMKTEEIDKLLAKYDFQTEKGYSICRSLLALSGNVAGAANVLDKYIDLNYNSFELRVWSDLLCFWALLEELKRLDVKPKPLGEPLHSGDNARSNPHQYRRLTLISGGIEKKDS
jgi:hypothetical protein